MGRVRQTATARRDVREIWDYIARDNPDAADRLVRSFNETLGRISDQPGIGRTREDLSPRLHSFPVGNYLLFYRAASDGIELIRVLHGRRDIPAIFARRRRPKPPDV